MSVGMIKKLVHLSNQTEMPKSNISPGHNFAGYGYIEVGNGAEIFFDHAAVAEVPFDTLREGARVGFRLEPGSSARAANVWLEESA